MRTINEISILLNFPIVNNRVFNWHTLIFVVVVKHKHEFAIKWFEWKRKAIYTEAVLVLGTLIHTHIRYMSDTTQIIDINK